MRTLRYQPLFAIEIALHPVQAVGVTFAGTRRIFAASGGSFEGARIKGTVLPHAGADWLTVRPDGVAQLDVRLTLKADDDSLILMTYRGIRKASSPIAERLSKGEIVDPESYYFRVAPFFETAIHTYSWLNDIVSVGLGERTPTGVRYELFEIL